MNLEIEVIQNADSSIRIQDMSIGYDAVSNITLLTVKVLYETISGIQYLSDNITQTYTITKAVTPTSQADLYIDIVPTDLGMSESIMEGVYYFQYSVTKSGTQPANNANYIYPELLYIQVQQYHDRLFSTIANDIINYGKSSLETYGKRFNTNMTALEACSDIGDVDKTKKLLALLKSMMSTYDTATYSNTDWFIN